METGIVRRDRPVYETVCVSIFVGDNIIIVRWTDFILF